MKTRGLVLVLCAAAGLALLPASAYAFEIEGGGPNDPDDAAKFESLSPVYVLPKFEGSSLAMPYSGSDTGFSGHVSDYGNSISIPAPGMSQPTPAYATSPYFR
jgi:hypothetical protein